MYKIPKSSDLKDFLYDSNKLALSDGISGGNIVYGSHKDLYRDISIVKILTKAKFPVYLVQSRITKQNYAMKVFGYEHGQPHLYYKNEIRFAGLRHPNIVRNLYFENERKTSINNTEKRISYKIMEYAPYGDLYTFLKLYRSYLDDKIIRTFFKQIIDGVEYLHQNGISHMDLKLDNILVDEEFNMRIADFDLAHYKDDAIIISNGTKFYRAPEVVKGSCTNTMAADIYSVAVILFLLKSKGVFPQFEDNPIEGIAFSDLLSNNVDEFWAEHTKINKLNGVEFDDDFKELFSAMTRLNPNERASIEEIKASRWYNGPSYNNYELKDQLISS